jgi:hypothetical protein
MDHTRPGRYSIKGQSIHTPPCALEARRGHQKDLSPSQYAFKVRESDSDVWTGGAVGGPLDRPRRPWVAGSSGGDGFFWGIAYAYIIETLNGSISFFKTYKGFIIECYDNLYGSSGGRCIEVNKRVSQEFCIRYQFTLGNGPP